MRYKSYTVWLFYVSAVNFVCDHPDIKAISFVGSDQAVSVNKYTEQKCY